MTEGSVPLVSEALNALPARPGVYLFKDEAGEILYVGKAKSLRARVRSYVGSRAASLSAKNRKLMAQASAVDTVVVDTEAEALILEANLIKEHHPHFNILLRDDKSYPYVRVSMGEPFPRVTVTRRTVDDGSRYFGPYTSVGPMRAALKVINSLHTVRSCTYRLPYEAPARPCLDYHIGKCRAPCTGLQSREEYRAMIGEVVRVLDGDTLSVRETAEREMTEAAERLEFEKAARLRDAVAGLDGLVGRQRVHRSRGGDFDVFGVARDGDAGSGVVLRIRKGLLLGRSSHALEGVAEAEESELVSALVSRYYFGRGLAGRSDLPRYVLLPTAVDDVELVADLLSEMGRKVELSRPQRGERLALVQLAKENARQALEDGIALAAGVGARAERPLFALQEALGLKVVPRLMACLDVSHTQGTETVASAVVFENGEPRKSDYRTFRIRGDWGNDDLASMAEAVGRFARHRKESDARVPDLILVDGGPGQLGAAEDALAAQGTETALFALAKREELVYGPRSAPVRLSRRNRALHLLQRMRDEAHRVAHRYNRKLRSKRTLRSDLGDIPGIGAARQRELLRRFGSLKGVREATSEEIASVPGIGRALALRVLTYLGR